MAKCDNCHKEANHIVITADKEYCEHCGGIGATGGVRTDGLASRSIFSIRESQKAMEGDLITPYTYDQNQGKMVINQDFIDKYPDQAHNYYSEDELQKMGLNELADKVKLDREASVKGQDATDVEFSGELNEEALQDRVVDVNKD